jgi:hypothetical protein
MVYVNRECLHYEQADGVLSVLSRSGHVPMLNESIAHWPLTFIIRHLNFCLRASGTECSPRWPFKLLHVFDNKRLYIMNQR